MDVPTSTSSSPTLSSGSDGDTRILKLQMRFRQSQSRLLQLKQLPELTALLGGAPSGSADVDSPDSESTRQVPESDSVVRDDLLSDESYATSISESDSCGAVCTCMKTADIRNLSPYYVRGKSTSRFFLETNFVPHPAVSSCNGIPIMKPVLSEKELVMSRSVKMKTEEQEPENAAACIRIVSVESLCPQYRRTWSCHDDETNALLQHASTVTFSQVSTLNPVSAVNNCETTNTLHWTTAPFRTLRAGTTSTGGKALPPVPINQQSDQILQSPSISRAAIVRPKYFTRLPTSNNLKPSKVIISSGSSHVIDANERNMGIRKRKQSAANIIRGISRPMGPRRSGVARETLVQSDSTKKPKYADYPPCLHHVLHHGSNY